MANLKRWLSKLYNFLAILILPDSPFKINCTKKWKRDNFLHLQILQTGLPIDKSVPPPLPINRCKSWQNQFGMCMMFATARCTYSATVLIIFEANTYQKERTKRLEELTRQVVLILLIQGGIYTVYCTSLFMLQSTQHHPSGFHHLTNTHSHLMIYSLGVNFCGE